MKRNVNIPSLHSFPNGNSLNDSFRSSIGTNQNKLLNTLTIRSNKSSKSMDLRVNSKNNISSDKNKYLNLSTIFMKNLKIIFPRENMSLKTKRRSSTIISSISTNRPAEIKIKKKFNYCFGNYVNSIIKNNYT
jgi:hypothetical protein